MLSEERQSQMRSFCKAEIGDPNRLPRGVSSQDVLELLDELDALRAEVERLREALQAIEGCDDDYANTIAREALK